MNRMSIFSLKVCRKIYTELSTKNPLEIPKCDRDPISVSNKIYKTLINDEPCMIARFGAFELATMINYLGVKNEKKNIWNYIRGKEVEWWWNASLIKAMHTNAGFFPPEIDQIEKFCELMIDDLEEMDILGVWLSNESYFEKQLSNKIKVNRDYFNPFFIEKPWTKALEGKRVLVVHPFKNSIINQFNKKDLIFKDGFLPDFELNVIPAVQSIAGEKTKYSDWFEALNYMKNEMDKIDYDICLIAAGAYGFPLAAHAKRKGKKAVHIGGSLQLFFGIKGKRWEGEGYVGTERDYVSLYNEFWIRPSDDEKPNSSKDVEEGCYW